MSYTYERWELEEWLSDAIHFDKRFILIENDTKVYDKLYKKVLEPWIKYMTKNGKKIHTYMYISFQEYPPMGDTYSMLFHRFIYIYYHKTVPDGFLVHHKDRDRLNNSHTNLEAISHSDHSKLHYKDMRIILQSSECKNKIKETMKKVISNTFLKDVGDIPEGMLHCTQCRKIFSTDEFSLDNNCRGRNYICKSCQRENRLNKLSDRHCLFCGKQLFEYQKNYCCPEHMYLNKRHPNRPSIKKLLEDLKELGSKNAVSRKYNVTDTTIRRWLESINN